MKKKASFRALISLLILGIVILNSCEKKDKIKNKEALNTTKDTITQKEVLKPKEQAINKSILGIWSNDGIPVFEISKDSVYYIDDDKSYKYTMSNKIIKIYYDDFTYKGTVDLKDDKILIIKDSININKYLKQQEEKL